MLAVALAACGGDGKDEVRTTPSSSTSSVVAGSTTAPPSADTTTTVEAGPGTTAADTMPPGTTGGPGPAPTAPPATPAPGPVPLSPAAPGVYHYATTGGMSFNGSPAPFPADTTTTVGAPEGSRQVATRNLGGGSSVQYTFDYRPDGVYLVALVFTLTYQGVAYPFALTPPTPQLFLATGASTGASQAFDIPTGSGSARVVVDVLGTEPVAVGGQSVDTLIVRSVATFPPGQISGSQTVVFNLDRGSRLWVRERGVGDANAAGVLAIHTEYTATLTSLAPG